MLFAVLWVAVWNTWRAWQGRDRWYQMPSLIVFGQTARRNNPPLPSQIFHLTAMWYCVNWWNARSDRQVVLCWLVEWLDLTATWHCADWWNGWIWPPRGTVLTGGMVWSDRHVALCWLVKCTIWPPRGIVLTGGMRDNWNVIQHSDDCSLLQVIYF